MGYKVSAEEEPNGINRTIEENLADKLEIIIENTVMWIVRVVNRSDFPTPLYKTHHCECELPPFGE